MVLLVLLKERRWERAGEEELRGSGGAVCKEDGCFLWFLFDPFIQGAQGVEYLFPLLYCIPLMTWYARESKWLRASGYPQFLSIQAIALHFIATCCGGTKKGASWEWKGLEKQNSNNTASGVEASRSLPVGLVLSDGWNGVLWYVPLPYQPC